MKSFCIECQKITNCVLLKYKIKHNPPKVPKNRIRYDKSTQCNKCKEKTVAYVPA